MRVFFEFSAISAEGDICTAVTAYNQAGSADVFTPYSFWSVMSADPVVTGSSHASAEALRKYYVDVPSQSISAGPSAMFATSSYRTGYFMFVAQNAGATIDVVCGFDMTTDAKLQYINNLANMIAIFTTGSKVVNTVLNELVIYQDILDASGLVTCARKNIVSRSKLYDAYGIATTINPVICETYQNDVGVYLTSALASGIGASLL